MSLRSSPAYRGVLIVLSLACLGGAGYLGYRMFVGPGTPEGLIDKGNAAYDDGVKAYDAKNYAKAAQLFDEAAIHADKARQLIDAKANTAEGQTAEARAQLSPLAGSALWLRARALRDREFARAAADGKPIIDTTDTSTGETYRNFYAMPAGDARKDAIDALMVAAARLDKNPDVLKEALRAELVIVPVRWQNIERYCRALVSLNPNDGRANYFLARFEYEQPGTTPDRKAAERMRAAADHIATAERASPPTPYWRTAFLKSQILAWQAADEARRRSGQPEKYLGQLRQLIFAERDGALAKATRGEHLETLSRYDVEGLFGIHIEAAELSLAEAARPGGDRGKLLEIARSATAAAKKVSEHPMGKPFASDITTAMVQMGMKFQSFADMNNADWKAFFDQTQKLAATEGSSPKPVAADAYGRFILREAFLASQRKDMRKRAELLDQGVQVLTKALTPGAGAPTPAQHDVADTQAMLAQLKIIKGEPLTAIEPHLAGVRAGPSPRHKVQAQLLEGVALQRSGRLEKARAALEQVTESKEAQDKQNPDLLFQANTTLANVLMASGNPAAALTPLQRVEEWYNEFQQLPAEDKALMAEFMPGPDELSAYIALANLETAAVAIRKAIGEAPAKMVPEQLYITNEKMAVARIQKLKPPSSADRAARLGMAQYYISTYRKEQAEPLLAALARDYPDSIEVLRSRVVLAAAPKTPSTGQLPLTAPQIQAIDAMAQDFLRMNPNSRQGKLFWAEWLRKSNRPHEAIKYLRDPRNFPARDEAAERLLASALLQVGEREDAVKVLSELTRNSELESALIQAQSLEGVKEKIQDAMGRTQNNGLLRVYAAALKQREGDYEGAVRGFASALDYAQAQRAARVGILRALVAYSQVNAQEARVLALKLAEEFPDEAMLPLGAAAAALALDDLGTPSDSWLRAKTMGAALNQYEALALKGGTGRTEISATKADLWALANRPDVAAQEAARALAADPQHLQSLLLLSGIALASGHKDQIEKVKGYVATMKEVAPDDTRVIMTEVRALDALGDLPGAVRAIKIALAKNPQFPPGYPTLVSLLDRQNDLAGAMDALKEWRTHSPNDPTLAIESIRLLVKAGKPADAKSLADQFVADRAAEGKKAADEIRVEGANAAELAKKKDDLLRGSEAQALGVTATGFLRAKDYAEAEARLLKVVKLVPESEGGLTMLGDLYIAQSAWDKALEAYRSVLAKSPQHFVAGNNAAWILARHKNDPAGALKIVEDVRKGRGGAPIAADRLPAAFLDTMGVVYGRLNRPDKFAEMKDIFELAVKRHPLDPRMYMYLGEAQAATGDKSRAMANFDSAVRLASPDVRNGLSDSDRATVVKTVESLKKKYQ